MMPEPHRRPMSRAATDFLSIGARARGLSTRLLGRSSLEELAGAPDFASLVRSLSRSKLLSEPLPEGARLADLEAAVRRLLVRALGTLERWAAQPACLEVFYADQDRRCLRALLRGALQGAPAEARLAGLLPTPALPERALSALAHEPTPRQVVTHLVLLSHPDAPRLLPLVAPTHPSWFELEAALLAGFVERSRVAASRDENLRDFVAQRVDLLNLATALLLASSGDGPHDAPTCFVPGGRFVRKGLFLDAAASKTAGEVLAKGLKGTPLEELDAAAFGDPAQLEPAGLKLALAQQRKRFGIDPTGSAALMLYLLRLEAQSSDLFRIAWGVTLGAPSALVRRTLVTP